MFAEMLLHSEDLIFLEPIDQYFEANTKFEPKDSINNESNDNLIKMNFEICDLLNEENDSPKKELNNSNYNNSLIISKKKYLMLNNYVNINKKYIDELKQNIYEIYKSQIETIHDINKALFYNNRK